MQMELTWVWGRFSIISVHHNKQDRITYYYPMERAGRLGFDHVYWRGDWVMFYDQAAAIEFVLVYAQMKPGERGGVFKRIKNRRRNERRLKRG